MRYRLDRNSAIRADDDLINPRLSLAQLGVAMALQLRAPLVG